MSATVYGRRAIRRMERETGEKIVHATGSFVTTIDHRHLGWTGDEWVEFEQADIGPTIPGGSPCGLPYGLSSCRMLFGEPEYGFTRGLLRGPCRSCGTTCGELHRHDCQKLADILRWGSVNPDYWPRPVHRPMWLDDPRRKVP